MSKNTTINIRSMIDIRKITLTGLMLVMCLVGYAKPNKVDSLSMRVTNIESQISAEQHDMLILQKEVEVCEKSLRCIDENVDRTNESISNQIAASSHTIQVWGWVIAVIAIVVTILMSILGVRYARYINKLRKNIALLSSDAKRKHQQMKDLSDKMDETQQKILTQQNDIQTILDTTEQKINELQELFSDIQKNSQKIYEKSKREETIALLNRLEEIPEDIENVSENLLARDLEESDFPQLLKAYRNLISRSLELSNLSTAAGLRMNDSKFSRLEESYLLLFAQHFMGLSILDSEVRDLLRSRFFLFFNECFFRNDAEKSTRDFKKGILSIDEVRLQMDLMVEYVNAITKSRYSRLAELYKTLLSDLSEEQLTEIWNAIASQNPQATIFAQVIKDIVETHTPQSMLLDKIAAYMSSQEIAEEKGEM